MGSEKQQVKEHIIIIFIVYLMMLLIATGTHVHQLPPFLNHLFIIKH